MRLRGINKKEQKHYKRETKLLLSRVLNNTYLIILYNMQERVMDKLAYVPITIEALDITDQLVELT